MMTESDIFHCSEVIIPRVLGGWWRGLWTREGERGSADGDER